MLGFIKSMFNCKIQGLSLASATGTTTNKIVVVVVTSAGNQDGATWYILLGTGKLE